MKKALLFVLAVLVVGYIFFGEEDASTQGDPYVPQTGARYSMETANYGTNNNAFYYIPNNPSSAKIDRSCPVCNGTGHKTCSSCHGEGSLYKTHWAIDFGGGGDTSYKTPVRCAACSGTGQMKCISCGGTGSL